MTNGLYRQWIQKEFARRVDRNARYSLRAFAQALGIPAGALSEILSQKTIPSAKRAQKIAAGLGLSPADARRFFASIAETQNQSPLQRRSRKLRELGRGATAPARSHASADLSLELFRVISDWHHYAIMLLTKTRTFRYDARWIAARLGISAAEAALAIDRLKSLGLAEEVDGRLEAREGLTTADKAVTGPALKRHQRQMLEKAIASLENDPISARSMSSITMAVDPTKLPQAREILARCMDEMSALLESGAREQVYGLQFSLFPISNSVKE